MWLLLGMGGMMWLWCRGWANKAWRGWVCSWWCASNPDLLPGFDLPAQINVDICQWYWCIPSCCGLSGPIAAAVAYWDKKTCPHNGSRAKKQPLWIWLSGCFLFLNQQFGKAQSGCFFTKPRSDNTMSIVVGTRTPYYSHCPQPSFLNYPFSVGSIIHKLLEFHCCSHSPS